MSNGDRRPGPLQAVVLLLQCTLGVMGTAILAPIIPGITEHFRAVRGIDFWAPLVVTVPSLCVACCAPLAGWAADMIGRRRLLIWAVGSYALLGVLPVFLDTITQVIASRIALGIAEAVAMTASTTLIGDYFSGSERDKWLGYQTGVASVSAVGMLALGGLLGNFGWRVPFLIYLSAVPLMCLVVIFTWEPRPATAGDTVSRVSWAGFPWSRMAGIYGLTLVGGMMFYIVQIQLSTALRELGVTRPSSVGLCTALVAVGVPVGTIIFQRISVWPIARLLALEFALIACGFIGMSHTVSLSLFLGFIEINQIGCGLLLPTMLTWTMTQLSFEQRGRGVGLWMSVLSLGPTIGPVTIIAIAMWSGRDLLDAFQFPGLLAAVTASACAVSVFLRPTGALKLPVKTD